MIRNTTIGGGPSKHGAPRMKKGSGKRKGRKVIVSEETIRDVPIEEKGALETRDVGEQKEVQEELAKTSVDSSQSEMSVMGLEDPDTILGFSIDPTFLKTQQVNPMKISPDKIWKVLKELPIPVIDLDTNPSTIAIMQFVREMSMFSLEDHEVERAIVGKAFQGTVAKEWCQSTLFNYEKLLNKLINWMKRQPDWIQTQVNLQQGRLLNKDITVHIQLFRLVAMYSGLRADSIQTKMLFMNSVKGMSMTEVKNTNGSFKTLEEIFQIASSNKAHYEYMARLEEKIEKLQEKEATATAAISRRTYHPQSSKDREEVRSSVAYRGRKDPKKDRTCSYCGKWGHFARECRFRLKDLQRNKQQAGRNERFKPSKQRGGKTQQRAFLARERTSDEADYSDSDEDDGDHSDEIFERVSRRD